MSELQAGGTKYRTSAGLDGLATFLFIFFIILKLTHVITWSWWWLAAIPLANGLIAGMRYFTQGHKGAVK